MGICYGHQLIAKALGGLVANNPKGKEISTVSIYAHECMKNDLLCSGMPSEIKVHVTHMQSVLTLPKEAIALAFNEHDVNHIVKFSNCIWGVQFHPEFDVEVMKSYIQEQESELRGYGLDFDKLITQVEETKVANTFLKKFVQLLIKRVYIKKGEGD